MKPTFKPKTKLGKLSIALIVLIPALFFIGMHSVVFYGPSGKTILQDIILRPAVSLPMLTGFLFGILAFLFGIIALIKKKDLSVLVFISTFIGFLFILFLLGEVLFPH
ncbi:MAG: hypothetical protein PWR32_304 [Candidatus Woesearchaeota archaeon]|nr:hypothetical protein [Candidatus Woesearchaeota archaeon]